MDAVDVSDDLGGAAADAVCLAADAAVVVAGTGCRDCA